MLDSSYIDYIRTVRRYSRRTQQLYSEILSSYARFYDIDSDSGWTAHLTPELVRGYEVSLLSDEEDQTSTVNLHLSVLSGFCRFLVKEGYLQSNPVRLVPRPRMSRRLPVVYRQESMLRYMQETAWIADEDFGADKDMYIMRLERLIVSMLYQTGIRRAELIGLTRGDPDMARRSLRVLGKGDKTRVIPLTDTLCDEIARYMDCAVMVTGCSTDKEAPLLVTVKGDPLYPVYVDRVVKKALGDVPGITVRKSPHVLRHTLATALLDGGADLNSIKEMLGHSSLAATQIYTHNSIEKLRRVYESAHPRARAKEADGQ